MVLYGYHLFESVVNRPLSLLAHFYLRPIHVIPIKGKTKHISQLRPSTGIVRCSEHKSHHKNWTKEPNLCHIQEVVDFSRRRGIVLCYWVVMYLYVSVSFYNFCVRILELFRHCSNFVFIWTKYYTSNKQIHDHSVTQYYTSNTQIHDYSVTKYYTSNTQIHDYSV
jgi:hypothetical protein